MIGTYRLKLIALEIKDYGTYTLRVTEPCKCPVSPLEPRISGTQLPPPRDLGSPKNQRRRPQS